MPRGHESVRGRDASAAAVGILTGIGREIMARRPPRPAPVVAKTFGDFGRAEFELAAGFASATWQLGAGGQGYEVTAAVSIDSASAGDKVWLDLSDGTRARAASYEANPLSGVLGGPVVLATRAGAGLLLSVFTDSETAEFGDVLFTAKPIPARI